MKNSQLTVEELCCQNEEQSSLHYHPFVFCKVSACLSLSLSLYLFIPNTFLLSVLDFFSSLFFESPSRNIPSSKRCKYSTMTKYTELTIVFVSADLALFLAHPYVPHEYPGWHDAGWQATEGGGLHPPHTPDETHWRELMMDYHIKYINLFVYIYSFGSTKQEQNEFNFPRCSLSCLITPTRLWDMILTEYTVGRIAERSKRAAVLIEIDWEWQWRREEKEEKGEPVTDLLNCHGEDWLVT